MKRLLAIAYVGLVLAVVVPAGCTVTQEQLVAAQQTAAALEVQLADLEAELLLVQDSDRAAELAADIAELRPVVAGFREHLAELEAGDLAWLGILEALGLVIAGAIPGAGIAIPFIRQGRRALQTVFASVNAGGGLVNPERAKPVLTSNAKAYAEFQAFKLAAARATAEAKALAGK